MGMGTGSIPTEGGLSASEQTDDKVWAIFCKKQQLFDGQQQARDACEEGRLAQ